ncbi:hypothetical protein Tco_1015406 [Tanacetum coccineum]|uniref:Uncharacterized protein n=1 Tax=Tanacetum coccineum TaxID=301880 RepID=A0ABQ5FKT5_9ASTR
MLSNPSYRIPISGRSNRKSQCRTLERSSIAQQPHRGTRTQILIPEIDGKNFVLNHGLINLVQTNMFFVTSQEDAACSYPLPSNRDHLHNEVPNVPIA